MKIIALISTYNRGRKINKTVESLLSQTQQIDKIIIIDDGSDKSKRVPELNNKKIKIIRLKKNVGVVWGRNYALSLASEADYVLIIDDDILLEKEAVKNMVNVFKSKKDVVAVMPTVYFLSKKNKVWSSGSGVDLKTGKTIFYTNKPDNIQNIPAATSVFLANMKAIKKAGWYDPLYYFCYEDADFYYRLREVSKKNIYCSPDAKAYHDIPLDTSLDRVAKRAYHIARGRVIFLSRYSNYFPLNLLFVLGFSFYYIFLGLKYGYYSAGYRYLIGLVDGLVVVLSAKNKLNRKVNYKKDLNISNIKKEKMKNFAVR